MWLWTQGSATVVAMGRGLARLDDGDGGPTQIWRWSMEGRGRRDEPPAPAAMAVLDGPRPPRLTERASPEQLRDQFGLSKKAFKRAVGRLLREGAIDVSPDGSLRRLRPRT